MCLAPAPKGLTSLRKDALRTLMVERNLDYMRPGGGILVREEMIRAIRRDTEQLLASFVRTLVRFPDSDSSVAAAAAVPPFPLWVRPNA